MRTVDCVGRIWVFIMLTIVWCRAPAANEADQFSIRFDQAFKCTVLRDGHDYLTIDLARFTTTGETLLYRREHRPISPDGVYIPFVVQMGNEDADILLLDLTQRTVKRRKLYRGVYLHLGSVEWVTTRTIGLRARRASGQYVIYNIGKRSATVLAEQGFLIWDMKGTNYVSIFGKLGWYEGRHPPGTFPGIPPFPPEQLLVSEALRYNSYWIYPKPLDGFTTRDEYKTWRSDISVSESGKGPEQPPIVRTRGVAVAENHVMTPPVFLGDTTWVGFFEIIFPLRHFDRIDQTNAVLLDAHKVHTNPPRAEDIVIKKQAMPPIFDAPTSRSEYVNLVTNIYAKWNDAAGCLELWRTKGWQTKYAAKKLGEIRVDLGRMEFGQWRNSDNDWVSLDPTVPASDFCR